MAFTHQSCTNASWSHHKAIELYTGELILGVILSLLLGFCLFQLFLMVGKGLMCFCCSLTQATARLLMAVMNAQIKPTFHKVNVHAALTPADILGHLRPAFDQAKALRAAHLHRVGTTARSREPFVTVSDCCWGLGQLISAPPPSTGVPR